MSEIDITTPTGRAALRKMAAAATPGPWDGTQCWRDLAEDDKTWLWGASTPVSPNQEQAKADAAFVAAARTAMPAALDELDRLTTALAAAREALRPFALEISPDRPDWIPQHVVCKAGHCRAARAALVDKS